MLDFFNTIQVSNRLDLDQAQHFDWPDLDPNCFQRLSADKKSRPKWGKEFNTKLLVDTTFWLNPWLNITMFHTSPHIIQLTLFNLDTGSNSKDLHEMHLQHKVAFHPGLHCLLK